MAFTPTHKIEIPENYVENVEKQLPSCIALRGDGYGVCTLGMGKSQNGPTTPLHYGLTARRRIDSMMVLDTSEMA